MSNRTTSLNNINQRMAQNIKTAREREGLTAAQLASKLGCSPRQILNIELGLTHVTGAMLFVIAEELGVSMDWLGRDHQIVDLFGADRQNDQLETRTGT